MSAPEVKAFFDEATFTVTYVVSDPSTSHAAIIDSVLDYDPASGRTSTESADQVISYIKDNGLCTDWILETHVHADHITAAPYLREQLGGKTAIGRAVTSVQSVFKKIFNLADVAPDGSQFDHLFDDGDTFDIGNMEGRVMATPGHTPACISYVIGDAAFVGDTLFMPDFGTARTDFPGGSAPQLYRSIRAILSLPADTRLYMCHDYKAPGRDVFAWQTSVAEQNARNIHINDKVTEAEFVAMREGRDAELGMPKLLLPAIQVNIRAGDFPKPEDNNVRYLKIPIDAV
ncbi:MAG: MBL fold metallo-hydrolase [Woeseiaceae bacterium]